MGIEKNESRIDIIPGRVLTIILPEYLLIIIIFHKIDPKT
jgi:hypothetical protein